MLYGRYCCFLMSRIASVYTCMAMSAPPVECMHPHIFHCISAYSYGYDTRSADAWSFIDGQSDMGPSSRCGRVEDKRGDQACNLSAKASGENDVFFYHRGPVLLQK